MELSVWLDRLALGPSCFCSSMLGLQEHAAMPDFYMGGGI